MNFRYLKWERLVPLILILSVLFNLLVEWVKSKINGHETLSSILEYTDTVSTVALIVLTLTFINFVGWKWKIFSWLVDLPNLNGRYTGELVSSFLNNGQPTLKDCVIEIKQTASYIHVYSYYGDKGKNTQTSRAYSVSEQIVQEKNGLFEIYYIFTNEPEFLLAQLNNHAGTARFKYFPDIKTLDGNYYNQRQNIGTIKVRFQQKQLLGRLVP